MFNTLDRYIGKTILATIFVVLFLLVGLSAIIKFVEQFRAIGEITTPPKQSPTPCSRFRKILKPFSQWRHCSVL